ncbi:replication protein C [Methanomicrobiaceae archaeon CYW5]|uniref:AAA family ATPase n=1 Tax=Methanovulcanius yangii TaxID=1789227 RepID=UPI0029C9F189|nr:AAA family ATPase [Methanovulcanius yangii]MBT8507395.1 replication protein C [Methanovulcanius yangii]
MLWIEKYRPKTFENILGQEKVVSHLEGFGERGMVPHLLMTGPHGTGKSCAVECLARSLYGDFWRENLSVISTGALFRSGKAYLEEEEKFAHLYRKDLSVINNFKRIVKWYASMKPLNAEFKLIVFDEADALTFEAQQALRRIMEQFSDTCRFIFLARTQSAIIPAISSRTLLLFFGPLPEEIITRHLTAIGRAESGISTTVDAGEIELIAASVRGDMRSAVMYLQMAMDPAITDTIETFSESETKNITKTLFAALRNGDFDGAKKIGEILMLEYGLSGREVLGELRIVRKREFNHPALTRAIADADEKMGDAGNEFVQLNALFARIIAEYPRLV